ncbi:AmmeMemoRadiSam system radical SAM enzyme [Bradyrhizobium sp. Ai1a-2]|uniref:AmmeMemoRadiSam system radical SAM enzyme n=1 Tax=Bradyrhizobium sp. Ai1a-2 TaxID=196490 RepID=UPI0004005F7E|nr:AmmeMemoRadiSam system radical SAM enzyme [Bradyrhizobium sp. Ai1a-2]
MSINLDDRAGDDDRMADGEKIVKTQEWRQAWRAARLEERLTNGMVRCHLSPRQCCIKEGRNGFCGVRGNRGGRLVTMNYGKSVHLTEETIETEAVNHFAPGEPILSLGNIGCMLNCVYCHNWKTSQARYVDDRHVYHYTPEQVVETALRHGIRVLSWTYNDPVVWHEFVCDTAALGRKAGLINLYKSAFFISPEGVEELLPHMDIFSISIKSIDPHYYKKYTTGWLEPVLEATKQVLLAGKHVEVSTLMITDISDDEGTAAKVADWVLRELKPTVPLHFVRFHPDYKLRNTTRTSIPRLVRAREIAIAAGVDQVYLGNVFGSEWTNTYCRGCGTLLVRRFGLNATVEALDLQGRCLKCKRPSNVRILPERRRRPRVSTLPAGISQFKVFDWHGDIRSLHVQALNAGQQEGRIFYRRRFTGAQQDTWRFVQLERGESYRFIVAKSDNNEIGPEFAVSEGIRVAQHEVFDRAHFPTLAIEEIGEATNDRSPLPFFPGNQVVARAQT